MKFIDTHSHIYLDDFSQDLDQTLQRALNTGVSKIFLPNIDRSSVNLMDSLSQAYPGICYPMMGLHPTSVKDDYADELNNVREELKKRRYYGIGETGIDLYWDKTFFRQQVESFREHLDLSLNYDLPVIIHCRNSYDEVISIIRDYEGKKLRGIFHAFSGSEDQAKEVTGLGFKLGIGGVLTYKNSGLGDVVRSVGLNQIVLETDSPFLPPVPKRGMRNEPSFILHTAKRLSEFTGIELDKVAEITSRNAEELFFKN